ncbi:MAG: ribbon-helix-helix protein, CopG family [Candidatus Dormibacteria bacterium]
MGKRISVYLEDEDIGDLNAHTRLSPLSRSEVISVALRRFLRDERRRARGAAAPDASRTEPELARRVAAGELSSQPVDGLQAASSGAPFGN